MSAPAEAVPHAIVRELYDALMAARGTLAELWDNRTAPAIRVDDELLAAQLERADGALADAGDYINGEGR